MCAAIRSTTRTGNVFPRRGSHDKGLDQRDLPTGAPSTPALEDGAIVQRITDAAALSARTGRWVSLEEISA